MSELIDTTTNKSESKASPEALEDKAKPSHKASEVYDCCICQVSSVATPDRPIGVVALLQSTSGNFGK